MTDPVNPFTVPDFDSPMQPLRPFRFPQHDRLYVDVDDSRDQYAKFQTAMGNLASLVSDGRIALITGDTGCGKSALVNRCAAWVVDKLAVDRSITAVVIDATPTLDESERLDVPGRIAKVCDQLYDLVLDQECEILKSAGLGEFKENRAEPQRVYRNLGRWLLDDHALILLLPPAEVAAEVIAYARLRSRKVLFMFESAWIDDEGVASIVGAVDSFTMPVTLRVGPLVDGDVRRYATARISQGEPRGRFPRMSEKTMSAAGEKIRSVAQLQRSMHSTYEFRLQQGLRYENDELVTIEDIEAATSRLLGHYESGTS